MELPRLRRLDSATAGAKVRSNRACQKRFRNRFSFEISYPGRLKAFHGLGDMRQNALRGCKGSSEVFRLGALFYLDDTARSWIFDESAQQPDGFRIALHDISRFFAIDGREGSNGRAL